MPTTQEARRSALGDKKAVPNLVQGVSQQAITQRRDTQCELQLNVFNSSVDGAMARNGAHLLKAHSGVDLTGAAFFETYYGDDEAYLVAVSDGEVYVFDLVDGTACTVTEIASAYSDNYLDVASADTERLKIRALTQGSTTFLLNREKQPAMTADESDAFPDSEALLFVKAGDYHTTYSVRLTNQSTAVVTTVTFTTPPSTLPTQQHQCRPSAIALAMAYGSDGSTSVNYDPWATTNKGWFDGAANSWAAKSGINGNNGYSASVVGSVVRIWRADNAPFTIETNDDNSDEFMYAIYGEVESFDRLPRAGIDGYSIKVRGEDNSKDDDYYLQFNEFSQNNRGSWEEVVGPEELTTLDPETMPHILVNTGYRTFDYKVATWSTRIAGDDDTAPLPSFIGKEPRALFWDNQRLGLLSSGSIVWSKSEYPYTFFKDTVQTILATDPVDVVATAPAKGQRGGTSPLDFTLQLDESLFVWSQYSQWRVATVNSEAFKEDTVEIKPSTNYEYNGQCLPLVLGQMALVASDNEPWSTIRLLQFQQGRVTGDTDITSHVPEYLSGGVKMLAGSPNLRAAFALTDENVGSLFLWNWLIGAGDGGAPQFLQSAWSEWAIPGAKILWISTIGNKLKLAIQSPTADFQLLEVPLSARAVDDDVSEAEYLTRLDYRVPTWNDGVSPVQATFSTFTSGYSEFTVPEAIIGGLAIWFGAFGWLINTGAGSRERIVFVVAEDSGNFTRGQVIECSYAAQSPFQTVRFPSATSLENVKGYIGLKITAQRDESEFFLRSEDGVTEVDKLQLNGYLLRCDRSLYTRVEVSRVTPVAGRPVRSKEVNKVEGGVLSPTSFTVQVAASRLSKEVRVSLINDTPFPSFWQSALWRYSAAGIYGAE